MSISKRKLAANRLNSLKSTGAVTPEGKQIVSRNAVKHGLCGTFEVIASESQEKFDHFWEELRKDEKPVGVAEEELVQKMAEYSWLRERATRFQSSCYRMKQRSPEEIETDKATVTVLPDVEKFIRYQMQFDRAYARAASELIRRKKERRLEAAGFASQKRAEAAEARAEKRSFQCDEMFKTNHAIAQKRRECVEADAILKGCRAGEALHRAIAA